VPDLSDDDVAASIWSLGHPATYHLLVLPACTSSVTPIR
jgi:hypothetical protein